MFNVFVVKKWGALILAMSMTTITFAVLSMFYGFLWGIAGYLVAMLVFTIVGNALLKNPFSDMLEGKGLLVLDINSTGIIQPFIVGVNNPYIEGKYKGEVVKDVFDRKTVMQIANPVSSKTQAKFEDGKITISLSEKEYNDGKFALYHYPVIIWNGQVKSILTKDFLAEQEKTTFAEHTVLYLNRVMENLTSVVRDFGRYVVELTKPQGSSFGGSWWIYLVVGGFIILMIVLFGPSILQAIQGSAGSATSTIANVGGGAIVPQ